MRISRTARSRRGDAVVSQPSQVPAYWLRNDKWLDLTRYVSDGSIENLASLIETQIKEVPRQADDIDTTLIGELVNLLANSGIPMPAGHRTPYGVIVTMGREESGAALRAVDSFLSNLSDENLLSDPSLILYSEDPQLVRRGIRYLKRALNIPSSYDALVLVAR